MIPYFLLGLPEQRVRAGVDGPAQAADDHHGQHERRGARSQGRRQTLR